MTKGEELREQVDGAISEVEELFEVLKTEIADSQKAVSFSQVKEIENTIEQFKKKRLPVPKALSQLKLKLLSDHEYQKDMILLYNDFVARMNDLMASEKPIRSFHANAIKCNGSYRKTPNYEKPLGSKGNSNLEDYLIPVIKLMRNGNDHREAFHQIAERLDVRYNTVSSQCTRGLGLSTEQFISQVKSKEIIDLLKNKFPDRWELIQNELNS